jgi:dipeptidyl aminopeptidase/acylaminoacyl peptidase
MAHLAYSLQVTRIKTMVNELSSRRDLRDTDLYREAHDLYVQFHRPGTGQISDIAEIHASPDGQYATFVGMILDTLEGKPPGRICRIDLATGDTRVLTFGPHTDRLPKYSPDGRRIAFLSDRARQGDFQLHLLDPLSGAAVASPRVEGWVEYLHWSPDGARILLAVAGHGADITGGQGAVTSAQVAQGLPSWIPNVEAGDEAFRWRRAWIYDLETHTVRPIDTPHTNIWEAVWCGNAHLAAVVSPGPAESLWYDASLQLIDIRSGQCSEIYEPADQLGWPAASPSGTHVAVVDTPCSDRGVVAGPLVLIETASRKTQRIDTGGVDVSHTEWRSDNVLLLAGHRSLETVVGVYDREKRAFKQTWASRELSTSGRHSSVSGSNDSGDCVLEAESFTRAPELAVVRDSEYRRVKSFDLGNAQTVSALDRVDVVTWQAPDGLEIQGLLLQPKGEGPYPLVLNVHGGPVWLWRPTWLGRNGAPLLMLLERGYAIFMPNPRGSSGRGADFARRVFGDIGGLETTDHLSGVDYLVAGGIADPKRLGVTGGSHGGFMTSWLISQDTRFSAAVSLAPITNWVSEHLTSNIAPFCAMSLGDTYSNPAGKYPQRSPVLHAHKVRTPTLNICGGRDRCTPPSEALQFHNALAENGIESVLVTYAEEGHGVRSFPAMLDYAARLVAWLTEHVR